MTHSTPAPDPHWLDRDGAPLPEEDRGLVYDVGTLVDRRRLLGLFGGIGATALLAACSADPDPASTRSAAGSSPGSSAGSTASSSEGNGTTEVPDETGGPFPGDGSNGPNVLDDSGIVRSDLRSSFGSSTATAVGIPLTVRLTVREAATGKAMPGAGVYVWHCTADGNYSLYSSGFEAENYLRGVQETGDTGTAEFVTVFPGCYAGRWPHIHFEVYAGLDDAVASGPIVKTSQIALPEEACTATYATPGYEASVANLAGTSLASDMVFADDGAIHRLASMSGDPETGFVAALTIGV
jgi:protocatechuate 3,4-dioxygenase beta subunit